MPKPWEEPLEEEEKTPWGEKKPWEEPLEEQKEPEQYGMMETAAEFMKPPIIGYGLDQFGRGIKTATEMGAEGLGFEGLIPGEQKVGEAWEQFGEQAKTKRKEMQQQRPMTAGISEGVGSLAIPGAGIGMTGLKGLLTRLGSEMGLAGGEAELRGRDAKTEALTTGGIQAGVETLPYVGKGAKVLGKAGLKPTSWLVDKISQYASPLMPHISQYRSNLKRAIEAGPEKRIAARATGVGERAFEVGEEFEAGYPAIKDKFSDIYGKAKEESLSTGVLNDLPVVDEAIGLIDGLEKTMARYPVGFKSQSKEALATVKDVMKNEGGGALKQDKTYDEIRRGIYKAAENGDDIGVSEGVSLLKQRVLQARKEFDKAIKSREGLTETEEINIMPLRDSLNNVLDKFEKTGPLREADAMWGKLRSFEKDVIDPVSKKMEGFKTKRDIKPGKLEQRMKTTSGPTREWLKDLRGMTEFVKKAPIPTETKKAFTDLSDEIFNYRSLRELHADLENLNRGVGGPTGQGAIGGMSMFGIASGTLNPKILLAMPIYNPAAYLKIKDYLYEMGHGTIVDSIDKFINTQGGKEAIQRMGSQFIRQADPDQEKRKDFLDKIQGMNLNFPGIGVQ